MFRATLPDAINDTLPLGMASFPMVPYANRIGHGRFDWNGQPVELELNIPSEAHALHGTGWVAQWEARDRGADSIVLHHSHKADRNWPWHFNAEQHIHLTEYGLTIDMVAYNCSDQMAPLGFGHHPYFDQVGASLKFSASKIWMSSPDALPSHSVDLAGQYDFSTIVPVAKRDVDHCYIGWDGAAHIRWEGRKYGLEIMASPELSAAVVYIPLDGDAFCFEPVPHINNALNMGGTQPAMPVIAPGAEYAAHIAMHAVLAD